MKRLSDWPGFPRDGRYGRWAGNEKGNAPQPGRCGAEVMGGYLFHQCNRKAVTDGLCCQHHRQATEWLERANTP